MHVTSINKIIIDYCAFDIQDFYKQFLGIKNQKSLGNVLTEFGVDYSYLKEHISRDDAELSMLVMKVICNKLSISANELMELCKDRQLSSLHLNPPVNKEKRMPPAKTFESKVYDIYNSLSHGNLEKICIADTYKDDDELLFLLTDAFKMGYNYTSKLTETNIYVSDTDNGKRDFSFDLHTELNVKRFTVDSFRNFLDTNGRSNFSPKTTIALAFELALKRKAEKENKKK